MREEDGKGHPNVAESDVRYDGSSTRSKYHPGLSASHWFDTWECDWQEIYHGCTFGDKGAYQRAHGKRGIIFTTYDFFTRVFHEVPSVLKFRGTKTL